VKQTLKPRADKQSESRPAGMMACLLKNEPASYSASQVKAVKGRSRSESESEKGGRGAE
jgi:hypothetical protein